MNGYYRVGVAAAIAVSIAFNLGMLIQKLAVAKTAASGNLMRQPGMCSLAHILYSGH